MAIRIGIGALLLAALVAVFSLRALPRPLTADLPAEAYDGAAALTLNTQLTRRFPDRRAGSAGDAALGQYVESELRRVLPTASVTTDEFDADTPDGRRTLRNVSATLPGLPGPEILVVAHRDALQPRSAAEMTGTSALLALARAAAQTRFRHTVQFVSTTGASGGGLTGATRLARASKGRVAAAIVLGDLSGDRGRRPQVVPWGNSPTPVALRLQRTVERALRDEGVRALPAEGAWRQLVRRGLPATVGEQGELNQADIPSVLMTSKGSLPPAADAPVDGRRFSASGRATLRTLLAVDEPAAVVGESQPGLVIADRLLPGWAVRVLLLCLLLPLTGGALVLSIALARDGVTLLAGLAWTLGCGVGPLIAGLLAIGSGRSGIVQPAVPAPFSGAALETGIGSWVLVLVLAFVLAGATATARPFLTREVAGLHRPTLPAIAFGVFAVLLLTVVVLLLLDPLAAYLLLPALAAWPLAVSPIPVVAPLHRAGLFLLGAVLPIAGLITVASSLDVGILQLPWWLVLLVAGGHVTPVAMLLISLVTGAAIAVGLSLVPPVRNPVTGRRAGGPDAAPRRPAEPFDDGWPTDDGPAVPDESFRDAEPHARLRRRRRRDADDWFTDGEDGVEAPAPVEVEDPAPAVDPHPEDGARRRRRREATGRRRRSRPA